MTPSAADVVSDTLAEDPVVEGAAGGEAAGEAEAVADSEEEVLPTMEDMEDLILEAYNNMQSDGEHIFLPPDVASKLHYIAQLVKTAGYVSDDGVSISSETNQEDAAKATAAIEPPVVGGGVGIDNQEPPSLDLDNTISNGSTSQPTALDAKTTAKETKRAASSARTTALATGSTRRKSMEPKVTEENLTISDAHTNTEPSVETLSPDAPTSPPLSARDRSTSLIRKPEIQRKSAIPPPTEIRRKTAPRAPSSTQSATRSTTGSSSGKAPRSSLTSTRVTAEAAPASRERSTSAYEQRREAALKLKEDKAQRELQAREAVRKQREDARRKLEDAHQKELEAKRERVARMKMQRKTPAPSSSTKPASIR